MKKKKYRAKNGSLRNTSKDSKRATFVFLKNHACGPIRKERLNPMSKARREASQNKFVKMGGMPHSVKNFREINRRGYRPRARLGFVKLIHNELQKKQI